MEHVLYIVANVRGKARKEHKGGREYLVAPITLLTPGVHNGSQGPIHYPPDLLSSCPSQWEDIPLCLDHPPRLADITYLTNNGLGLFRNVHYDWALRGEGWFDVQRMKEVTPSIYESLKQGKKVEVSSGLGMAYEILNQARRDHKGSAYRMVAKEFLPDHVAILSGNNRGACGIEDGCGVFNHSSCECGGTCGKCSPYIDPAATQRSMWQKLGEAFGFLIKNAQPSHSMVRDQLSLQLSELYPPEENEWGYFSPTCWIVDVYDKYVVYEHDNELYKLSYKTDLRGDAVNLLDEAPQEVRRVITYKDVDNKESGTETVTITKTEIVTYEPITSTETETVAANNGLSQVFRNEIMNRLLNPESQLNTGPWRGMSRDQLDKQTDEILFAYDQCNNSMNKDREGGILNSDGSRSVFNQQTRQWQHVPAPKPADDKSKETTQAATNPAQPAPVTNGLTVPVAQPVQQPKTDAEYLATLPPHLRQKVERADQITAQHKAGIIQRLVANSAPEQKAQMEAVFNQLPVEQLDAILKVMPVPASSGNETQQTTQQVQNQTPFYDYTGAAGAPVSATPSSEEEPLVSPVYNWGEWKGGKQQAW